MDRRQKKIRMQGELYAGSGLHQRCLDADSVCGSAVADRNHKKRSIHSKGI